MALSAGTRLGPYTVTAKIGEGGMGEVYQARDTKLDRDVALKVLPEAFTSDPDRLARFEREAKVLASLNHPNIGSIYGLEEAAPSTGSGPLDSSQGRPGAFKALVLELVDGPTLADRITQGPIPLDEALPIAKQIAEALEAAHEQGVIHRDLKPANIKVKADGTVKVLDFGLAKAFQPDATDPSLSASPTISLTAAATQMGMVIGTAAYMAPEQASGKAVDRRADVWAFGVVVYEMLTGTQPFAGDDVSKTLAHVIAIEPDWSTLPETVPPVLGTFLRGCLEKNLKARVQAIGDVRLAMEGAFETGAATSVPEATPTRPLRFWQRPAPLAVGALMLLAAATLGTWLLKPTPEAPTDLMRFTIATPDSAPFSSAGAVRDVAIARDGSFIVYAGPGPAGTGTQLYVRQIDELEGAPLRGTEGGVGPFISPDGDWVGFTDAARTTLLRVPAAGGGPPDTIGESSFQIRGAVWADDGQILFGVSDAGLFQIPSGGGEPEPLTTPDAEQGEDDHSWPAMIPGANAVLYVTATQVPLTTGEIAVLDLESRVTRRLGIAGISPQYVATGHLVYVDQEGTLRAVTFDAASLEVTGTPAALVDGVTVKPSGAANFVISSRGRLVYGRGGISVGSDRTLVWVGRDGQEEPVGVRTGPHRDVSLSPDGTRIATTLTGEDDDVWIFDLARTGSTRLTFAGADERSPLWAPDGDQVVFASNGALYRKSADGTGDAQLLAEGDLRGDTTWTADGRLVTSAFAGAPQLDIVMVSFDGSGSVEPLLDSEFAEQWPSLSPDGRWLAYVSDESGRAEIYVTPFPEVGARRWSVSTAGGEEPVWSRDGRELFYVAPEPWRLMRVAVDDVASFVASVPTALFDVAGYLGSGARTYQVDTEGERFLFIAGEQRSDEGTVRDELILVENWFEDLKARVPVN